MLRNLLTILMLLWAVSAPAQQPISLNTSKEIKDILIEAKNVTIKTNFKSSVVNDNMTVLTYHMLNADGKSLDRTEQVFKGNALELVYLYNENGYYEWSNKSKTVIQPKPTFHIISTWQQFLNTLSIDDGATFSKENTTYYDIPCYQIIMIHKLYNSEKKTTVYTIGKTNHFIYSCYWQSGDMETPIVMELGNVVFNPTFDSKIFEVPQDKVIENVETKDEYSVARKKLFN